MRNKKWLGLFLMLCAPGSLWADPCDGDLETYCSDRSPGASAIATCLEQNRERLSHACRERITKIDQALRKKLDACSSDARDFCRDVKPGYGRIKSCLLSNLHKLSTGCRDALQ